MKLEETLEYKIIFLDIEYTQWGRVNYRNDEEGAMLDIDWVERDTEEWTEFILC